jgi:predicted metal-dependent hydrolase
MSDGPQRQLDLLEMPGAAGPDAPVVRVSTRARRLAIRVYPDARVEVVVPRRVRPREVETFVAAHREWIDKKRSLALRNRPAPQPFPPATIELRLTGESIALNQVAGEGARPLRWKMRRWLMSAARKRLEPRVRALAATAGVSYKRVSIRRQRSRWGSCSARGTISLNCCLLFQRAEVVDYLVMHELMHLSHMNHSAAFWQAVERHCADWRVLDRELMQGWRHVPRWVFSDE